MKRVNECVCAQSYPTLRSCGPQSARLLRPRASPGKNTGAGSLPLVPPRKPVKGLADGNKQEKNEVGCTSGLHTQGEAHGLSAYHFLSLHPLTRASKSLRDLAPLSYLSHLASIFLSTPRVRVTAASFFT